MKLDKYSERMRSLLQSAQALALREGHRNITSEHSLKVLLEDQDQLAVNLIRRTGGNAEKILKETDLVLQKIPAVTGSGAGQIYLSQVPIVTLIHFKSPY